MTDLSQQKAFSGQLDFPDPDVMATVKDNEPSLDVPTKMVAVHLVSKEELMNCTFWIGLFQHGKLTPKELLDCADLDEIFHQAARLGIKEAGPLMLSDSSKTPARYIYLLPEPGSHFRDNANWINELVSTVKSWAPQRVGIYLAPELILKDTSHDLLLAVMRELILTNTTRDFFLYPGLHGMNSILNAGLRLKDEMGQEQITLYVFH